MSNITQVINVDKHLKTLKKSMHSSDLDQLLSSTGPFTFFAPSDTAFEKLDKGVMENLLEPKNHVQLIDLLNNHIVNGKVDFKDLKDGDTLNTLNGKQLQVHIKNEEVFVGAIAVHNKDCKATNGVIHAIDAVVV